MSDPPFDAEAAPAPDGGEADLRLALARGDATVASAAPVLRHLLSGEGNGLFADAILARVHGMLNSLSAQLAAVLPSIATPDIGQLGAALREVPGLTGHLHALAIEAMATEQLQARGGVDEVLSPLLQALVASSDPAIAAAAMKLLAAQARFVRGQQRMELAITELPGELLHGALAVARGWAGEAAAGDTLAIAAGYDEGTTRLGLLNRLVTGMGQGGLAGLTLDHAGIAIFCTTLSLATGHDRDGCALLLDAGQGVRLALSLRALGLRRATALTAVLSLHPDAQLPAALSSLRAEQATAMLRGTGMGIGTGA